MDVALDQLVARTEGFSGAEVTLPLYWCLNWSQSASLGVHAAVCFLQVFCYFREREGEGKEGRGGREQ